MTEEIIIDGVNVAECYYMYDNEDLDYMCQENAGTCICRENKNCYYKQMKRLEAENTKLKEKYREELTVNTQLQEWRDEDLRQITSLKRELEQANEWNKTLWEKLEKIKEIAKENNICEGFGCIAMYKILFVIEGAEDE